MVKLVIQRVVKAKVTVEGKSVGQIDEGLLVLVGVGKSDSEKEANFLAQKLSKLRILADAKKKMNLSTIDKKASILAVSQFTLFADTSKGNRPSFVRAAGPKKAEKLYEFFVEELRNLGLKVETGMFGEYMDIETWLDGPVTIILES